MRELTLHEMEEVNGGVAPVIFIAYVAGVDLGLIASMYVVSLAQKH